MRKLSFLLALILGVSAPVAAAPRTDEVPEWAQEAVDYLAAEGLIDPKEFRGNDPMARTAFGELLVGAFGGNYRRTKGHAKAGEVDALLVKRLGYASIAKSLDEMSSPDGWTPQLPDKWFGTEIVARELGLRHNRPAEEDAFEASAREPLTQADIAWAVWRAKTNPSTWGAEALADFSLADYSATTRSVIEFGLAQVGQPYVWAGEWAGDVPDDYPYGAQAHGGFDCSGFAWYVLREANQSWDPVGRPYEGWLLDERASRDMAAGAEPRLSFGELEPGDLLFFADEGYRSKPADVFHAGIYLGGGWMIHSSGSRNGVSLTNVDRETWWAERFAWGRRILPVPGAE